MDDNQNELELGAKLESEKDELKKIIDDAIPSDIYEYIKKFDSSINYSPSYKINLIYSEEGTGNA